MNFHFSAVKDVENKKHTYLRNKGEYDQHIHMVLEN
jgi:hypothetical protein